MVRQKKETEKEGENSGTKVSSEKGASSKTHRSKRIVLKKKDGGSVSDNTKKKAQGSKILDKAKSGKLLNQKVKPLVAHKVKKIVTNKLGKPSPKTPSKIGPKNVIGKSVKKSPENGKKLSKTPPEDKKLNKGKGIMSGDKAPETEVSNGPVNHAESKEVKPKVRKKKDTENNKSSEGDKVEKKNSSPKGIQKKAKTLNSLSRNIKSKLGLEKGKAFKNKSGLINKEVVNNHKGVGDKSPKKKPIVKKKGADVNAARNSVQNNVSANCSSGSPSKQKNKVSGVNKKPLAAQVKKKAVKRTKALPSENASNQVKKKCTSENSVVKNSELKKNDIDSKTKSDLEDLKEFVDEKLDSLDKIANSMETADSAKEGTVDTEKSAKADSVGTSNSHSIQDNSQYSAESVKHEDMTPEVPMKDHVKDVNQSPHTANEEAVADSAEKKDCNHVEEDGDSQSAERTVKTEDTGAVDGVVAKEPRKQETSAELKGKEDRKQKTTAEQPHVQECEPNTSLASQEDLKAKAGDIAKEDIQEKEKSVVQDTSPTVNSPQADTVQKDSVSTKPEEDVRSTDRKSNPLLDEASSPASANLSKPGTPLGPPATESAASEPGSEDKTVQETSRSEQSTDGCVPDELPKGEDEAHTEDLLGAPSASTQNKSQDTDSLPEEASKETDYKIGSEEASYRSPIVYEMRRDEEDSDSEGSDTKSRPNSLDVYDLVIDEDVTLPSRPSGTGDSPGSSTPSRPVTSAATDVRCERCGLIWPTPAKLAKHAENCTGPVTPPNDPEEKRHKCVQCDFHSKWAFLVRRHQQIHGIFACQHCDMLRSSEEELQQHIRDSHPQTSTRKECPKCSSRVPAGLAFEKHLSRCPGREALICPVCQKVFKQETRLKKHVAMHEGKTEYFECELCEYKTNIKSNLKKHQSTAHAEEPGEYICEYKECGKKFTTAGYLKRHIRVHTEGRPHVCHICSKAFTTEPYLSNHLLTHNPPDAVPCSVEGCTRAFKTVKLMDKHRMEFHGLGVKQYVCSYDGCDIKFYKESHLKRHVATHTGERRFKCDWPDCNKAFRHADNLKVHYRQHTNEKPFSCGTCGFTCRQKSSLQWHQKKHCAPDPEMGVSKLDPPTTTEETQQPADETPKKKRKRRTKKEMEEYRKMLAIRESNLRAATMLSMSDGSLDEKPADVPNGASQQGQEEQSVTSSDSKVDIAAAAPVNTVSDVSQAEEEEDDEDIDEDSVEDFSDVLPQGGYDDGEVMFKASEVMSEELSQEAAAAQEEYEKNGEEPPGPPYGHDMRVLESPISDDEGEVPMVSLPPRPQDSPTLGASRASTETSADSLQSSDMGEPPKYPGPLPPTSMSYEGQPGYPPPPGYPEHTASAIYYSEPAPNRSGVAPRAEVSVISSMPSHMAKDMEPSIGPHEDPLCIQQDSAYGSQSNMAHDMTEAGMRDVSENHLSRELPDTGITNDLPAEAHMPDTRHMPDAHMGHDPLADNRIGSEHLPSDLGENIPRSVPYMVDPPPAHQQTDLYTPRDLSHPAKDMYGSDMSSKDGVLPPSYKHSMYGDQLATTGMDSIADQRSHYSLKEDAMAHSSQDLPAHSSSLVPSDPLSRMQPSVISSLAGMPSAASSGQYPQFPSDYHRQFPGRSQDSSLLSGASDFYNQFLPECSGLGGDRYGMSSSQSSLGQSSASGLSSSLPPSALPPAPQSFQALQRTELLRRASVSALADRAYPSSDLHQSAGQWGGQDSTPRHWTQPSPLGLTSDLSTGSPALSKDSHYYDSMDPSGARQLGKSASSFGMPVPSSRESVSESSGSLAGAGALDSHMMASMYMGRHFPPHTATASSYQRHSSTKGYEDSYRSAHMPDYRSLQQTGPPDMFGRMGMSPAALGLDKYYYARDSMYRGQGLGTSAPFLPPSTSCQIPPYPPPPSERDYSRSAMYPQPPTPYAALMGEKQYLSAAHKLGAPPMPSAPADYFGGAPPPPNPAQDPHFQDPYRRSVIYNMMNRYLS